MVAVALVRVVQVARDEVVDVVAVGDWLVAAALAVDVAVAMSLAGVAGAAVRGVRGVDGEAVLVDVVTVDVVQVAVVQVVGVALVRDGGVAAAGPVGVGVGVVAMAGHGDSSGFCA